MTLLIPSNDIINLDLYGLKDKRSEGEKGRLSINFQRLKFKVSKVKVGNS